MIHLLPAHTPRVDDEAKAVGGALLARQARRRGDELEMHRSDRVDVVEREDVRVLVDFAAGNFAAHDLAEQAIRRGHLLALRFGAAPFLARGLLVDPGYALAAAQLGEHVRGPQTVLRE